MSNKIDNAMDVLAAKLTLDLVTNGSFKALERRLINPFTQATFPVVGVIPLGTRRTTKNAATEVWETPLSVRICCRAKDDEGDAAITERLAEFMAAVDAYNALAAPRGVVDKPDFHFWYIADQETLVPVGAIGTLRLKTDGVLLDP